MKKVKSLTKLPANKLIRKLFPAPVVKTVEHSMKSDVSRSSRAQAS
jgi:hypothetical protein